jgi:hypothetical protein
MTIRDMFFTRPPPPPVLSAVQRLDWSLNSIRGEKLVSCLQQYARKVLDTADIVRDASLKSKISAFLDDPVVGLAKKKCGRALIFADVRYRLEERYRGVNVIFNAVVQKGVVLRSLS